MAKTYHTLPGLDGGCDLYAFTVLDACVVKELSDLFRSGLHGIKHPEQRQRLKGFLWMRHRFGEIYTGVGAAELSWAPDLGRFDAKRFREYLTRVEYVCTLNPEEWTRVAKGGEAPGALASAPQSIQFDRVGDEDVPGSLDVVGLITNYVVLREAWTLAQEPQRPPEERLAALRSFIDEILQHNPGVASTIATVLLAGNTREAEHFRKILKFGTNLDPLKTRRRIRSAAWDIYTMQAILFTPYLFEQFEGEGLRPACGLTADTTLAEVARILRRSEKSRRPDLGPTIVVPVQELFSSDRRAKVDEHLIALDTTTMRRMRQPADSMESPYAPMDRAQAYLDSIGDTTWGDLFNVVPRAGL